MDKSNKKKIIISVISIIALVVVVASATYAWWVWHSDSEDDVTINLTGSSIVTFRGGTDISGTLIPVTDWKDNNVTKSISVSSSGTSDTFSLYLHLTTLPTALKHQSFIWILYDNSLPMANGNFASLSQGDTITLLEDVSVGTTSKTYVLRFWIDGKNFDNPAAMAGQTFYFNLYATGSDASLNDVDS